MNREQAFLQSIQPLIISVCFVIAIYWILGLWLVHTTIL